MSSVRAQCGPAVPEVLTESTPPAPTDAYGRAKLAAEREIAALPGPHVILRPTLVYGRGVGGNMGALIRLARLPLPLPFGAMRNARSLLAVENLIEAVVLALTSEALLNGTFLVADATPLSFAEILAHLRRGAGRDCTDRSARLPAGARGGGCAGGARRRGGRRLLTSLKVRDRVAQHAVEPGRLVVR
jgi:UDP-glucose 4-epimerase